MPLGVGLTGAMPQAAVWVVVQVAQLEAMGRVAWKVATAEAATAVRSAGVTEAVEKSRDVEG